MKKLIFHFMEKNKERDAKSDNKDRGQEHRHNRRNLEQNTSVARLCQWQKRED